jgi:hypothetical protein
LIDRRTFLGASAALLALPLARLASARDLAGPPGLALADDLERALEKSEFVYVSPLRADGSESTCHGEVWYAWLDGAVVLNTKGDTWKARALARGLERARVWVGDHGRWKGRLGKNEAFRGAPSFDARVERSRDAALLARLLEAYDVKYPDEIGRWRDPMRDGFASGERLLLRYVPSAARSAPPRT